MVLSLNSISTEPGGFTLQGDSGDLPELVELGCGGALTATAKTIPTLTHLLVDMEVRGSISLDCGRCMEKLTGAFSVKLRVLVEKREEQGQEWIEFKDQPVEEYLVAVGPDVTEVPLEHLIAEQIILNYNLHPMPSLDDKERCLQCGRSSFYPTETQVKGDRVDPRWEKLQALKRPGESGQVGPEVKPGDPKNGSNPKGKSTKL